MSASNEWTEWHLTPRGWERGREQVDFAGITERDRPSDAGQTVQNSEYMGSIYSASEKTQEVTWECGDRAATERLLAQFGPAPKTL